MFIGARRLHCSGVGLKEIRESDLGLVTTDVESQFVSATLGNKIAIASAHRTTELNPKVQQCNCSSSQQTTEHLT